MIFPPPDGPSQDQPAKQADAPDLEHDPSQLAGSASQGDDPAAYKPQLGQESLTSQGLAPQEQTPEEQTPEGQALEGQVLQGSSPQPTSSRPMPYNRPREPLRRRLLRYLWDYILGVLLWMILIILFLFCLFRV